MDSVRGIMLIIWIIANYGLHSASLECLLKQEIKAVNNSSDCFRECEFPARPRVCEYEFTMTWGYTNAAPCLDCPENKRNCELPRCVTADGSSRAVIMTNYLSPGPSIQVCHGDIIRVKVNNDLLQDGAGLTIHWHGIHQFETIWSDGVPMITQCPIPIASSFVYKFVADPPGTHWWHSQNGVQRGDGLYGALIVRVPRQAEINSKEYDFDLHEHWMIFNDWLSTLSLDAYMVASENGVRSHSHTYSILTNGKNECVDIKQPVPRAVFEVEEGYRYRMRLVNSAFNTCNLNFTIKSHKMTIIATDGFELNPVTVDALTIVPGERIDFVLEASGPPSIYCMYLVPVNFDLCPGNGTSILKYKGARAANVNCTGYPMEGSLFSTLEFKNETDMNNTDLITYAQTYSYQPVDPDLYHVNATYYMTLDYKETVYDSANVTNSSHFTYRFQINRVEFLYPETPFVHSKRGNVNICEPTGNDTFVEECLEIHCRCTNVLRLKLGQVVEFVMMDTIYIADHPMHLHGHSFRVLAQGKMSPSMTSDDVFEYDKKVGIPRTPLNSSVVKDTISVPAGGYAIIRWKAENPGYWAFHCHSEYHSLLGMMMVIQVGEDDEIPQPPKNFPSCGPWSPD